jgi:hypothetical protein
MLKRMAFILSLVMLFGVFFGVQAQDSFGVGESVEGEISDSEPEVTFTLSVSEGEIVVLEMRRAEDSDLYSTALKITDPSGDDIYNNTGEVTEDVTVAGFRASAGGDYTVVASRGEFSTSTGAFILRAIAVEELAGGSNVEGTVNNDSGNHYYALPADTGLSVSYEHRNGNSYLDFDIWLITDTQGAVRIATGGAIEDIITTFSLTTDDDRLTLVSVGASVISFQYDDVETDYTLSVA